jgi:hypothetical protein
MLPFVSRTVTPYSETTDRKHTKRWLIKIYKKQRAEAVASDAVIKVIGQLTHYCVMNNDAGAIIAEGFRTAAAAEAYAKVIRSHSRLMKQEAKHSGRAQDGRQARTA